MILILLLLRFSLASRPYIYAGSVTDEDSTMIPVRPSLVSPTINDESISDIELMLLLKSEQLERENDCFLSNLRLWDRAFASADMITIIPALGVGGDYLLQDSKRVSLLTVLELFIATSAFGTLLSLIHLFLYTRSGASVTKGRKQCCCSVTKLSSSLASLIFSVVLFYFIAPSNVTTNELMMLCTLSFASLFLSLGRFFMTFESDPESEPLLVINNYTEIN